MNGVAGYRALYIILPAGRDRRNGLSSCRAQCIYTINLKGEEEMGWQAIELCVYNTPAGREKRK